MLKNIRNYYNEEKVQELLREYKSTAKVNEAGITVFKNVLIENQLVKEIEKIVNAIIMVYRYYVFEDYNDLKQHAITACYTNFLKFDKGKGTSFNYFSLISKISLLNYTTRKKKHRNHQNIEEQLHIESRVDINFDLFLDELENTLFSIIDENFIGSKRTRYIKIASLILDYLSKTKKFVSKSDLYAWCRSFGIKNSSVREFVNDMSQHREMLFEGVI